MPKLDTITTSLRDALERLTYAVNGIGIDGGPITPDQEAEANEQAQKALADATSFLNGRTRPVLTADQEMADKLRRLAAEYDDDFLIAVAYEIEAALAVVSEKNELISDMLSALEAIKSALPAHYTATHIATDAIAWAKDTA